MAKLPRYDLTYNKGKEEWQLKNPSQRVVESFDTKSNATAGGVLSNAIGDKGGSVRIHNTNGRIQEERTFPRSADPRKSPG